MNINGPYYAIKVIFPSNNEYWFGEIEDSPSLVFDELKAKVFLTEGSAERYIEKLRKKFPIGTGSLRFAVRKLKEQ